MIPPRRLRIRWLDLRQPSRPEAAGPRCSCRAPEDLFEGLREFSTAVNRKPPTTSAALIEPLAPGAHRCDGSRGPAAPGRPKKETDDGQQSLF